MVHGNAIDTVENNKEEVCSIDLIKLGNLIFLDNLNYESWDLTAKSERDKNLVHGLRNALIYGMRRGEIKGLMKKIFYEFLEEIKSRCSKENTQFLEKEINAFLKRHKIEIL